LRRSPGLPGIDLHAHSDVSDGTVPPADLVREAGAAGLDVLALTDHDTTAGWSAAGAALPAGLGLVPGAELSCVTGQGQRRTSLHMLAYLFDPAEPTLLAELARLRAGRVDRGRLMVEALIADGYPISWEQVRSHAAGSSVGRPHIARALVAAGLVPDVASAFSPEWIADGGRYYRVKAELDVFDALALVRGAGGVSVFAHPGAAGRGPVVDDDTIATMASAGLAGLEVDHGDHDGPTRGRLRDLAAQLSLVVTGGSDYHGTSKIVRLGAETTAPEVLEFLLEQASGATMVRG
jgi:predicted metal-dependent phosphoesterase TrpH